MKNQLGVDMLYLASEDRVNLLKGAILRRLPDGNPLNKEQLENAIECDLDAIKQKWSTFDHKEYIGMDMPDLYKGMLIGQLISERTHASEVVPIVERGHFADSFLSGLSGNLQEMIEYLPMSTRGFFDNLRVRPQSGKTIKLTMDEFKEAHADGEKKVLVDDSHVNPMRRKRDSVVDNSADGLIVP